MDCMIPHSPKVTFYTVNKTDENMFSFFLSDLLKTKFHNHGKKTIHIHQRRKNILGVPSFSTQHLRFLEAFKAPSCFPKEKGMPSPPFQMKRLQI